MLSCSNINIVLNFDIEIEHAQGKIRYYDHHNILIEYVTSGAKSQIKLGDLKSIKEEVKVYCEEKEEWQYFENTCYAPRNLGFPDPHLAECEVLSVALTTIVDENSNDKIIYVIGTKDYTGKSEIENTGYKIHYTKAKDEKELLLRFIQKWREIKPDIITGWNIEGFDIPYMVNRITRILGSKYTNMLSPFSSISNHCIKEKQKDENLYYSIAGIIIYDYLSIYKKFSRNKQESYKLDWIGQVEVNHAKVSFPEYNNSLMTMWEFGYDKFIYYNAVDTLIVSKIDNKLKFINLAITIAHITKSDLSESLGTIKIWDSLIYKMLSDKNVQLIPNERKEKTKPFIGAAVKEPQYGRSGWTLTFDLTSLYPSIIRMLKMSPDTLVHREVGSDIYANAEQLQNISENIEIINDILKHKQFGNDPFNYDEINLCEILSDENIHLIKNTHKQNIINIKNELDKLYEYYSSGHQYLHGVNSVMDNVDNFIEMKSDLNYAYNNNLTVAANGSSYDKTKDGVIPQAMTMLFNYRKEIKTEMKKVKQKWQDKIKELNELEKCD